MMTGTFSQTSSNIRNNIGNSTQFGTQNGNKSNVDMATVFVETGSSDGKYKLKNNSPAIGAGSDGEDCGMFGGASPYKLSGIPNIPNIYSIEGPVSGSAASGLPIQVKIKSN